ncbi:MAG: hypothetical protein F6K26_28375 [Moorea sp. SIO2I5]|nr:hypothetical protein [Moorena sp. SIO2I5]
MSFAAIVFSVFSRGISSQQSAVSGQRSAVSGQRSAVSQRPRYANGSRYANSFP